MENINKETLKINGLEHTFVGSIDNPIDITDNNVRPICIVPGYYKIKMHENIGNQILTVKVLNSTLYRSTLYITLTDNMDDYLEVLYWNGGWKFNGNMVDSIEDWISWYDYNENLKE